MAEAAQVVVVGTDLVSFVVPGGPAGSVRLLRLSDGTAACDLASVNACAWISPMLALAASDVAECARRAAEGDAAGARRLLELAPPGTIVRVEDDVFLVR